jgi:hypothetical protein
MARSATSSTEATLESETAVLHYKEFVGDTLLIELGYGDEDTGIPYDLAGWDVAVTIKQNGVVLQQPTVELNHDIPNGYNIRSEVTSAMTQSLGAGIFELSIVTTELNGFVNTLAIGTVTLRER